MLERNSCGCQRSFIFACTPTPRCALPYMLDDEWATAHRLVAAAQHNPTSAGAAGGGSRRRGAAADVESGGSAGQLSEGQRAAVEAAVRSRLFVLTGGPGVGKVRGALLAPMGTLAALCLCRPLFETHSTAVREAFLCPGGASASPWLACVRGTLEQLLYQTLQQTTDCSSRAAANRNTYKKLLTHQYPHRLNAQTFTIRALVDALRAAGDKVALCAPTGECAGSCIPGHPWQTPLVGCC